MYSRENRKNVQPLFCAIHGPRRLGGSFGDDPVGHRGTEPRPGSRVQGALFTVARSVGFLWHLSLGASLAFGVLGVGATERADARSRPYNRMRCSALCGLASLRENKTARCKAHYSPLREASLSLTPVPWRFFGVWSFGVWILRKWWGAARRRSGSSASVFWHHGSHPSPRRAFPCPCSLGPSALRKWW